VIIVIIIVIVVIVVIVIVVIVVSQGRLRLAVHWRSTDGPTTLGGNDGSPRGRCGLG
jgi:hypothetical protein